MTTARFIRSALLAGLVVLGPTQARSATIQIVNLDGTGEGFNDGTARAPIGGNPGTTLGAQRINVFTQAASVWGALLPSSVTIRVGASFDPLSPCNATSGVLGSAYALTLADVFAGQEFANTWYPIALANKLAGSDLSPGNDIRAQFNVNVDNSTCLGTTNWYYGYNHAEGTNIDLLAVVLHELGHGLGFASYVDETNGVYCCASPNPQQPDVFTRYLYDDTQNLYWTQMSNAQRQASAINDGNLVWKGSETWSHTPETLWDRQYVAFQGTGFNGEKQFGTAEFGPPLASPAVFGQVVYVDDGIPPNGDACSTPFVNQAGIAGKIALIDRGDCTFVDKAVAAQDAGAIGVIIANNVAGIVLMAGTDPSIVIPVVSITQADGTALKTALLGGSIYAELGAENGVMQGADAGGFPRLYAPNPVEPGSSVSHFDVVATPNLLMEPALNLDLTSDVDLTLWVFHDIGWFGRTLAVENRTSGPLRLETGAPNPFRVRTSIRYQLVKPGYTEMGVYDVTGRLVKRLLKSWMPAGSGAIAWDATDDRGGRVPPGVYLYRIRSNGESQAQRVVVSN